MSNRLDVPRIRKNTKLGDLLNGVTVESVPFERFSADDVKGELGIGHRSSSVNAVKQQFIRGGRRRYIVSGRANVRSVRDGNVWNHFKPYSFMMKARRGLTGNALRYAVWAKLYEFFRTPQYGNSHNDLIGMSVNSMDIPNDFRFHKSVKMFDVTETNLKIKELENFCDDSDYKKYDFGNCMVNMLYVELRKKYKRVTQKKIINGLNKHCDDIMKKGCTLQAFEEFMKDYKCVSYDIIGPDYKFISRHTGTDDKDKLIITCYINNAHVYPINDTTVQKHIRQIQDDNYDLSKVFKPTKLKIFENYEYITDYDKLEDGKTYICGKDDDINFLLQQFINETGYAPEYIDMDTTSGRIITFKHPKINCYITEYDNYHKRKATHEKLNKMFNNSFGKFYNKSYARMSKQLMNKFSDLPVSYYNKEAYYYLNEYEVKPMYEITEDCKQENMMAVDFTKQYASIFYKDFQEKNFFIPIYDIHNCVVDYDGGKIENGEYYVKPVKYANINFGGCFIHSFVVKKLLKGGFITKDDITKCITTNTKFKPKCYKQFVKTLSKLDEKSFKLMSVHMNGILKNSVTRTGDCFFTNDVNILAHLIITNELIGKKITWNTNKETGYNVLKTYSSKEKYDNTSSFYRATLSCSLLQTLELVKKVSKYGEVVKVQTDAVYYKPHKWDNLYMPDEKDDDIIKSLGTVTNEVVKYDISTYTREPKDFIEYKETRKLELITGVAGAGKSWLKISECDEKKKILFLSTSNNAVLNMMKKAIIQKKIMKNWDFFNITLYFISGATYGECLSLLDNNYDLIVIDEIYMTSQEHLRRLLNADVNISIIGDVCQVHGINNDKDIDNYDPATSHIFKNFSVRNVKYNPDKGRYDKKTFKIFNKFNRDGYSDILKHLKKIDKNRVYPFYLCWTNETRRKYTKLCCDEFYKDGKEETFEYRGVGEKYKIGEGMPIICTVSKYNKFEYMKGIPNNWKGFFVGRKNKNIIIKGELSNGDKVYQEMEREIPEDKFFKFFLPLHASTIYKYQGNDIEGDFCILELDHISTTRNTLYTSLTRCNNYKQIHIDHSTLKSRYFPNNYKNCVKLVGTSKKERYIYKLSSECKCKGCKVFYVMSNTVYTSNNDVINRTFRSAHLKCGMKNVKYELHETLTTTTGEVLDRVKELNKCINGTPCIKKKIFRKMIKEKGKESRLLVTNKYVRYIYYDEEDKIKKIQVNIKGKTHPQDAVKKMFVKNGGRKADKIEIKTNMHRKNRFILCFD